MDIKEAFHSLDHNFLVSTLEKYGFDENFIAKVIVSLRNQGSRVLNGGTITKYFLLRRGALQGDLHPTFLMNWTLKILFHLLKSKSELKGWQSLVTATFTLYMLIMIFLTGHYF